MTLTEKEIKTIITHLERDLEYRVGGTFNDGEDNFDQEDADLAMSAIAKLKEQLKQRTRVTNAHKSASEIIASKAHLLRLPKSKKQK